MERNKETIVFIHGYSNTPNMWASTINHFEAFNCITLDMNIFGEELLAENIKISTVNYAHKVQDYLISINIQKFHLVGHSMGGYISAAFASLFSDCLLSLTLVHAILGSEIEEKMPIKLKSINLIQKGDLERQAFLKALVNNLFYTNFRKNNPDLVQHYIEVANSLNPTLIIEQYKAIIERPDLRNIVNDLKFPIHWMVGTHDKVVPPPYALEEITSSPKAFISTFNEVGHMAMDESLDVFTKQLKSYIQIIQEYYP